MLKNGLKLVYVENKVVKIFLYYMRDEKIFVIYNNLKNHSYMISCNPAKALGKILYFIYI